MIFITALTFCMINSAFAKSLEYIVVPGDSLWKIAVKYQIGLSELAEANPQIKDLSRIYVGQKIYIPNIGDIKSLEQEVIRLVNIERAKNGLAALNENWELSRIARYKSNDMVNKNYFSHQSPTYGSPFDMIKAFGLTYKSAAENIAKGQNSASSVVSSWMSSPGHRANILNSSFNQIGVGAAKDSKGNLYWTQMFIKS